MSGGVDSSVAAVLLKDQGFELIGATMALSCSTSSSDRGCCSFSAAEDAKKVCTILGILHYTLNFKDEFKKFVIDNFIAEYKSGRTPNPCVRCNQFLKFDLLLMKAKELGAEFVATGHYARIQPLTPYSPSPLIRGKGIGAGGLKLLKGRDVRKDQSYVLYMMTQSALAQTLFPLGELTKEEVRKIAREKGLPVADKEESQEICFVDDDDYGQFLREAAPELIKPGNIVDKNGNIVGQHQGVAFYTLGQRKGLGHHKGEPKYVIGLDRAKNQVIIGDDRDTLGSELIAEQVGFISGQIPAHPLSVTAKIRYNSRAAPAVLSGLGDDNVRLVFTTPQRSITPGQSVVFYNGEEVLGGGIIR
ncbi:tRNA 2-thiouridine(34) synthase MnmA [Candidatus Saganbacteria bacterium]|nr:tRNA 2-thiouridine(34) synthase MnmA [Candidatus Saganbacteria bacterium]